MTNEGFRARLKARQEEINSLVCVGLDPVIEKIPEIVRKSCTSTAGAFFLHMKEVADATASSASVFKPQHANWERIDNGTKALQMLLDHLRYKHPKVLRVGDVKRGDIDRTQGHYREAHFTLEGFDGINYNGYMGKDTLEALIDRDHYERALIGLGRTSNKMAWRIQDQVLADGRLVWEDMAECVRTWSEELGVLDNAGIVMGAAHEDLRNPDAIYSGHLSKARMIFGEDLWMLIPGFGKQKGAVKETVIAAEAKPGNAAFNDSSGIDFAGSGLDFAGMSGLAAEDFATILTNTDRKEG